MKTCMTQTFMFLNEYRWIANSYVAVSVIFKVCFNASNSQSTQKMRGLKNQLSAIAGSMTAILICVRILLLLTQMPNQIEKLKVYVGKENAQVKFFDNQMKGT